MPETERAPIRLPEMPHSTSPQNEEDEELGEEIPSPSPYVSYIMIAVITMIFAVMWWQSGGNLGALTIDGEYSNADLYGQKNNDLIRSGQYWRFLTPVFLHGSPIHLITNALSIYWLGTQIEKIYGARRFLIIYILAGIAGNVVSFMQTANPSLGASGAIFGLIGAGLIFPLRFRSLMRSEARDSILKNLLTITAINIGMGYSIPGVDNMAHMGGLAGGGLVALFLIPDVLDVRPISRLREILLSLISASMLVLVAGAVLLQVNWSRAALSSPTTMYSSSPQDPYWTVRIPVQWIWNKKSATWRSADGAILSIADNVQDPILVQQIGGWMSAARNGVRRRVVDGKPAVALELLARDQNRFVEMVLVAAYERQIGFVLFHKGNASVLKSARDFDRILRSVRIVHAPKQQNNSMPALQKD